MENGERGVRLRQAVLVAEDLEAVAAALSEALGLLEPYRDPGVGEFGLANVVFALGDCFLEVVSPLREGTAAGRHLQRHGGDGGYMVIFDLRELDQARERAQADGVRVVWQIDLPDISGTHLHPADMRGAIVSVDRSEPYGTWRWGGPQWTGQIGEGAETELCGITVEVADPLAAAERWGRVLGVPLSGDRREPALALDGAAVSFREGEGEGGLVEIELALDPVLRAGREAIEVGGVTLRLRDRAE